MEEKEELLQLLSGDSSSIEKAIKRFEKKRDDDIPDPEDIKKQLDPEQHDVFDAEKRPDKKVKADEGEIADAGVKMVTGKNGQKNSVPMRFEKVARIGLSYQAKIVNAAAAFAFGTPVKYNTDSKDATELKVLDALKRVIYDNKMKYVDQQLGQELFAYTEIAELWLPIEGDTVHNNYGFPTKFKLRVTLFKPSEGNKFFPYFDASGDLIAFARSFKIKEGEDNKEVDYFEVYTDKEILQYKKAESDWTLVEGYPLAVSIGKIQVVYGRQDEPDFQPVQSIIKDDETLRSNFSDTNAYHSDPTTVVKGKINGFSKKGQAGKVIEIGQDADVSLLESRNAAEGVKSQHAMNREDIFSLTQTPETSFFSMKGIGNLGAAAQRLLFMDAHLKVKSKEVILGPYLQRRTNIIKAYIGSFYQAYKAAAENVIIEPEITPFIMGDDSETINMATTAVNAGVMSRKTAVQAIGWVQDTEEELLQIENELKQAATMDMFPMAE